MDKQLLLFSKRWILAYLFSTGFFCMLAMRVNISLAIICMVQTPVNNASLQATMTINASTDTQCDYLEVEAQNSDQRAEFTWDKGIRSSVLTAYFYGYIITQIPGGWLADRFGGRLVFGVAMAVAGLSNILMPVCARLSHVLVYALRFILGAASGVTYPVCQSMWGRWAPILQRSTLVAISHTGAWVGIIVTYASSGVLCEHGFDNGWASIFYITGGLSCVWVVIWLFQARDSPAVHPRISEKEKEYIFKNIGVDTQKTILSAQMRHKMSKWPYAELKFTVISTYTIPWKQLLKSGSMWAIIIAHVCNNWSECILITLLPEFLKDVLKFDIKSNGVISAAPYLCLAIMSLVSGLLADYVIHKHILTTTQTRKVSQSIAFIGAAIFLVAIGFVPCTKRELAVVFLCFAVSTTGFMQGGFYVNHIDIAPNHAGILLGIANTIATIPGFISPIVAGMLTPNGTQDEWRVVFYISAAFYISGTIFYVMFASGVIQSWAKDNDQDSKSGNPSSVSVVSCVSNDK